MAGTARVKKARAKKTAWHIPSVFIAARSKIVSLAGTAGLLVWTWNHPPKAVPAARRRCKPYVH